MIPFALRPTHVVLALLVLLLGYTSLRLHFVKSRLAVVKAEASVCESTNASQTEQIHALAMRNNELVSSIAADTAAAQQAATRYLALEAQYESLNSKNEALRDQLGRDNPETGRWLAAGMDARIACSLWEDAACKK